MINLNVYGHSCMIKCHNPLVVSLKFNYFKSQGNVVLKYVDFKTLLQNICVLNTHISDYKCMIHTFLVYYKKLFVLNYSIVHHCFSVYVYRCVYSVQASGFKGMDTILYTY